MLASSVDPMQSVRADTVTDWNATMQETVHYTFGALPVNAAALLRDARVCSPNRLV